VLGDSGQNKKIEQLFLPRLRLPPFIATPDEPAVAPVPAPQAVSPAPPPATVAEPPPLVAAAPLIRYPLGELSGSAALPELERSDAPFFKALGDWLNRRLPMLFFSDAAIRRIVETVDNLPRQRLPPAAMPLKPVPGRLSRLKAATGHERPQCGTL
jgi:hypothetical protein